MADAKNCSHQVFGAQLNTQKQSANTHCMKLSTVQSVKLNIVLCCIKGWQIDLSHNGFGFPPGRAYQAIVALSCICYLPSQHQNIHKTSHCSCHHNHYNRHSHHNYHLRIVVREKKWDYVGKIPKLRGGV